MTSRNQHLPAHLCAGGCFFLKQNQPAVGKPAEKNMRKMNLKTGELRKYGFQEIYLFWDTEIAVFQTKYNGDYYYTVANPTDWHHLTEGGFYGDQVTEIEYPVFAHELECAKKTWKQVRDIARLAGVKWLDAPYMSVARQEYTDVFVRVGSANFLVTQHCGIQIMPSGQFLSKLFSDFKFDKKLHCDVFKLTLIESYAQIAIVDLAFNPEEHEMFQSNPYGFDGENASKTVCLDDTVFFFTEEGVEKANGFIFDFEVEKDNEGYLITPSYEPEFPYALFNAYKEELRIRKY